MAAFDPSPCCRLGWKKYPPEIYLEDAIPFGSLIADRWFDDVDSRVADECIDSTKPLKGRTDEPIGHIRLADISAQSNHVFPARVISHKASHGICRFA